MYRLVWKALPHLIRKTANNQRNSIARYRSLSEYGHNTPAKWPSYSHRGENESNEESNEYGITQCSMSKQKRESIMAIRCSSLKRITRLAACEVVENRLILPPCKDDCCSKPLTVKICSHCKKIHSESCSESQVVPITAEKVETPQELHKSRPEIRICPC